MHLLYHFIGGEFYSTRMHFPPLVISVCLHFPDCTQSVVLTRTKHPFKLIGNKALIKNAESGPLPPYKLCSEHTALFTVDLSEK